ncbi:MAG: hypothetical protein EXR27_09675 [Betaproteobacteria bacterium]|nr:hypothetical protein [Betaproteobacteria bacterium]
MRRVFIITLAALLTLVGGCSGLQLGYNNADVLARYMMHDYLDFDSAQDDDVKARLVAFHSWHRQDELPAYLEVLKGARARAVAGVQTGDIDWGMATLRERYRLVTSRAAQAAAPVLVNLSAEQIVALEKNAAKKNAKFAAEFIIGDEKKLHRARTKRMLNTIEDWTGDLTNAQEARVERLVREHARIALLRFEDRQRWQRAALVLVRKHRTAAELGPHLAELFASPEKRQSPQYLQGTHHYEQSLAQLAVDLDRSLSPAQRVNVFKRFDKLAADLAELAEPAGAKRPR